MGIGDVLRFSSSPVVYLHCFAKKKESYVVSHTEGLQLRSFQKKVSTATDPTQRGPSTVVTDNLSILWGHFRLPTKV